MADLRYIDDAGQLRVTRLGSEHFLIGRANTCQIVFVDDMISREHARLDRDRDGRYRIRDLGSRNKTYVNGQQVAETLLAGGDVIRLGDHVLEFLDDDLQPERLSLDFLTPDRKEPTGSEWVKIKAPVTLSLDQISKLAGVSAFLGPTSRAEEIAEATLSRLIVDLQADRGFVARRGERKGEIVPIAHRGLSLQPGGSRMPVSQAFVSAAMLQGVGGRYPREASQIDAKVGYAATGLIAPLVHRNDILGLVYVDRVGGTQPFSAIALQHITAAGAALGGMMAEASRRLAQTGGASEAAWLSVVRRMQAAAGAVPQAQPPFESAWKMQNGALRCGDLCDVIAADDGRCVLVVVDAGGGGVDSLSQAIAIRTGIRSAIRMSGDPMNLPPVMDGLNQGLAGQRRRRLVTCVVVGVDLAAGRIAYVNAGGLPPLLMAGPGRLITLDQPSLMLGIDGDYAYEAASVDLPADFRIVCHTDGLTNSANASGEAFGEQRLHELLLDRDSFTEPASLAERILGAVSTHRAGHAGDDDATVLLLGKG
ncbi:MAG: SpoIIE family protein phosphatase [Phycisphaerales bacterium]|nr:MAG: SpoIIE family protein phosphatase [Phycisphaerales bacterium]